MDCRHEQGNVLKLIINLYSFFPVSCLALSDLLRGRNLDDVVDYLPQLWETCFRVLDDIKVRICWICLKITSSLLSSQGDSIVRGGDWGSYGKGEGIGDPIVRGGDWTAI